MRARLLYNKKIWLLPVINIVYKKPFPVLSLNTNPPKKIGDVHNKVLKNKRNGEYIVPILPTKIYSESED